ncbi:unnamed protein product [Penicillium discolor]
MAAVIKAINAKIRSNSVLDYVCSTRTYRPRFPFRPEIGQRRMRPKENKHLAATSRMRGTRLPLSNLHSNKAVKHFWGPVSNFGIPIAAVMDTQKDAEIISGPMTGALVVYAATFMRYSLAITPKNYLLFACHLTNFGAQSTQAFRYLNYWKWGGREQQLAEQAAKGGAAAEAGA